MDNIKVSTLITILVILMIILTALNLNYLFTNQEHDTNIEQNKQLIEDLEQKIEEDIKEIKYEYQISSFNEIFNENDITIISKLKVAEIDQILSHTAFEGLGYIFIEAEQTFQVNALFLVGLAANESGWGTSRLAIEKNNITGFRAYNSDPFNNAKHFDSWEDCILQTAEHIRNNYLNVNGNYYNGVAVTDINTRYAINDDGTVNTDWSNTIIGIAERLKGEL